MEIPLPRDALMITVAPASLATAIVLSSDLSSTTIISETAGSDKQYLTTWPSVFYSFKAGIITVSRVSFVKMNKGFNGQPV
jgi:hypothetical protein